MAMADRTVASRALTSSPSIFTMTCCCRVLVCSVQARSGSGGLLDCERCNAFLWLQADGRHFALHAPLQTQVDYTVAAMCCGR